MKYRKLFYLLLAATLMAISAAGCSLANHAPVISGLFADKDCLCAETGCRIDATVSDPDGDELTYQWLASSGQIFSGGPNVTWQAPPTPGAYTITLKVTDDRGGEATMTITLGVVPNRPPVIESLTAEEPSCELGSVVQIDCIASDPDGDQLSYKWTAEAGTITGQGAQASWVAPFETGYYDISVEITDGKNGRIVRTLTIYASSS